MEYMQVNRANGRAANELRPVKLTRGVMKHAHGSCLAERAVRRHYRGGRAGLAKGS